MDASFESFVAARSRHLLHAAHLLTGDRHRAEDLLQTALTRAYLRWDRIDSDDPEGYVRRTMVNFVRDVDLEPQVYWRITDNWLELTVRFLTGVYGVRGLKDEMSREIMSALDEAGIGIASATYEITGVAPVTIRSGD